MKIKGFFHLFEIFEGLCQKAKNICSNKIFFF